jgi:hypothetical protein
MDSKVSGPSGGQRKTYSSPKIEDLGAIEHIALAGVGSAMENAMPMTNLMKHP